MRTKATNFLQFVVLLTGIIYIIIGLTMYISPLTILKFFAGEISEGWLDLVRDNVLVAPLYYFTRGFSALLFTSGIAMTMPLFDPLKYRGLIYFNGLLFPLLSSSLFLYNGIIVLQRNRLALNEKTGNMIAIEASKGIHMPVVILGGLLTLIFVLTLIGLIITKKQAHDGVE